MLNTVFSRVFSQFYAVSNKCSNKELSYALGIAKDMI